MDKSNFFKILQNLPFFCMEIKIQNVPNDLYAAQKPYFPLKFIILYSFSLDIKQKKIVLQKLLF